MFWDALQARMNNGDSQKEDIEPKGNGALDIHYDSLILAYLQAGEIPIKLAIKHQGDAFPSSLWTHLRVQVCDNAEGVGTWSRSLTHNTWRGRGACWSFGIGLGRCDKLIHSHGLAQNPHKVVSA
jgi:hypothetical protein